MRIYLQQAPTTGESVEWSPACPCADIITDDDDRCDEQPPTSSSIEDKHIIVITNLP